MTKLEEDAHYDVVISDMLKNEPRPASGLIDRSVAVIYEWRPGVGYVNLQIQPLPKEDGQEVEIIHDQTILTLNQKPPYVRFSEKDIELMREAVREYDAKKV